MTFDDGPDRGTAAVLATLDAHQAHASFFVLTDRLRRAGGLVLEAASAGHTIGLHGDRHEALHRVPTAHAYRRLLGARHRLEDALQRPVTLYRPPYGWTSLQLLRAAAQAGLLVVLWSHDPQDWLVADRDRLAHRLVHAIRPRAVVLLHDRCHRELHPSDSPLAGALHHAASEGLTPIPLSCANSTGG